MQCVLNETRNKILVPIDFGLEFGMNLDIRAPDMVDELCISFKELGRWLVDDETSSEEALQKGFRDIVTKDDKFVVFRKEVVQFHPCMQDTGEYANSSEHNCRGVAMNIITKSIFFRCTYHTSAMAFGGFISERCLEGQDPFQLLGFHIFLVLGQVVLYSRLLLRENQSLHVWKPRMPVCRRRKVIFEP